MWLAMNGDFDSLGKCDHKIFSLSLSSTVLSDRFGTMTRVYYKYAIAGIIGIQISFSLSLFMCETLHLS
jgi:hypothetical protein